MIQIRTNKNLSHAICYENIVDIVFFFLFKKKACDKLVNNNEWIKTNNSWLYYLLSQVLQEIH